MTGKEARKEAIRLLEEERDVYIPKWIKYVKLDFFDRRWVNALELAIKALEHEPKWIPVSEMLPEDNKEVLVYVNAYPYLAWLDDGEWKTEDFIIEKDFEPIAWMPLPEPYKAESEE